ncbi:hypothetical protein [Dokdonella sp.]|uniref:energy transducer TonB n=1 Tax=Dokdonella sp. TaxID=2291710 RepID=UPI0025BE196A|nr:hypothetical protein [Dokdonella sp.]MBX3692167.1 energy transducer TonB [Dokdonella sp.]MCW5567793.1 energy transducer TonB [Dokdonella sp.]
MSARLVLAAGLALVPALAIAQQAPRSVTPEALEKYWVLIHASVAADVPLGGRRMTEPGCAAVSFVVEKNGRTSNVKVQRVEPPGDLGTVAASAAAGLEFEPTISNAGRDRVFSSLIFPFNLPADPEARSAVMQKCVIPPLRWSDPAARVGTPPVGTPPVEPDAADKTSP